MRPSIPASALALALLAAAVPLAAAAPAAEAPTAPPPPASPAGAAAPKDEPAKPVQRKLGLAVLRIRGEYPEGAKPPGILGAAVETLPSLLERIDEAARDPKIAAVLVRLHPPIGGWGKVEEIRAALARVQKAGKKTYAFLDVADNTAYLLATACGDVAMPESGLLACTGPHAEAVFFKGLFDKIGLQADMVQVGKSKGAAEPFTRASMSDELKAEISALLDDYFAILVETTAAARGIPEENVRRAIDEAPLTAGAALDRKLIDRVLYLDEYERRIKEDLKADVLDLYDNYGAPELDLDFSGFGGFMKLMKLLVEEEPAPTGLPRIAVIHAGGMIVSSGEEGAALFGGALTDGAMIAAIRKAAADEKVAALVLRIDSPGGSAIASDLIWHEISRQKKPVVASLSDVAASGGYYLAMGCRKIVAAPGSLTGSIGVVGGKFAMGGLFEKIGVNVETVSRGKNAGFLSATAPFSDSEREAIRRLLDDVYARFVDKAARGRNMERKKMEPLAEGRIYSGRRAAALGLVDKVGTLHDAIEEAKALAGLPKGQEVELLHLPRARTVFDALLGPLEGETLLRAAARTPFEKSLLQDLRAIPLLTRDPVWALSPFRLGIR